MFGAFVGSTIPSDLRVFAVCSSVLYVKFFVATVIQGHKSYDAGSRAREDNRLCIVHSTSAFELESEPKAEQAKLATTKASPMSLQHAAHEQDLRWKRIVQNDLESIPMAFAVFGSAIAMGGDSSLTSGLLITYTITRIAHTISYANELQPHRLIAWLSGVTCTFGAAASAVTNVVIDLI